MLIIRHRQKRYPHHNELKSPEPCQLSKKFINLLPSSSQPELDQTYEKDVSELRSIPSLQSSSRSRNRRSYISDDELDSILECSDDNDIESNTYKRFRDDRSICCRFVLSTHLCYSS